MKNKKLLPISILILITTYIVLRNSIYSNYAKYILFISIPVVIYYAFINFNTFGKSSIVNSNTEKIFKDENLQLVTGAFLVSGLILKYFDLSFWKIIALIGVLLLIFLLARRVYFYIRKQ